MTLNDWKLKNKARIQEYNREYKRLHPGNALVTREYQKQNRERLLKLMKRRILKHKLKAIAHLGGKCSDCAGTFNPAVFDFHHVDPTQKDSGVGVLLKCKWERILPELEKCVLLCANCHRTLHNKNIMELLNDELEEDFENDEE